MGRVLVLSHAAFKRHHLPACLLSCAAAFSQLDVLALPDQALLELRLCARPFSVVASTLTARARHCLSYLRLSHPPLLHSSHLHYIFILLSPPQPLRHFMSSLPSASTRGTGNLTNSTVQTSASASVDLVYDVSRLLHCGLDKSTVAILVALCECGVQPQALATVVKELRREATAQPQQQPSTLNGSSSSGGQRSS